MEDFIRAIGKGQGLTTCERVVRECVSCLFPCRQVRIGVRVHVVLDISSRRMAWWVAADAVRDIIPLVNADVIDIHFAWELQVLEVLRLEVGGHPQV